MPELPESRLPAGSPLEPFKWGDHPAITAAIKACYDGAASPEQQTLAIKGIVEELCCYYDISFRGTDRETNFAEGKRFVGAQIVKLTKINQERIRQALDK